MIQMALAISGFVVSIVAWGSAVHWCHQLNQEHFDRQDEAA